MCFLFYLGTLRVIWVGQRRFAALRATMAMLCSLVAMTVARFRSRGRRTRPSFVLRLSHSVSHMASRRGPAEPLSPTKKIIHGMAGGPMAGVPMAGVINYPFKVNERLYYDDFAGAISSRITHPYLTTAKPTSSLPFNVLSNSAAESSASGWATSQQLAYTPKTPDRSSGAGVRTEQQ